MSISERRKFAEEVENKVSELNDLIFKAIINHNLKADIKTFLVVGIPRVSVRLSK